MLTLRGLLNTVGIQPESLDHIKIIGKDPILPTPFRIGETGAIILAAIGYSIEELWYAQTGRRQTVEIGVKEAAIAQRSHQYLRIVNEKTPELWDPISGFYRTKDNRWIQLHCNFPHHRQGVIETLQCADEKAAVEKTILENWEALNLETVLSEKGLCASMVRTTQEWQASEQARSIARLPPIEIIKIGESLPEALPISDRPLAALRVLDLTRVIAGPICARTLAEQGANVLNISSPHLPSIAPLVMDTGHGKYSAYLDLNQSKDCESLKKLAKSADVFLQAYRPGALADKGFSKETLSKMRPGIIYVELSAYSHVGPWAGRHGYDSLVQSATGIAHEQGIANGTPDTPQHLPAQSLDYIAGYLASLGVLVALQRRMREGGSYYIRTSLAQIAHWIISLERVSNYERCKIPLREDIPEMLTLSKTEFGLLEHLKPVLKFSETTATWKKTTTPLGTDQPKWE
ncbi:MAG: CoA transferase [Legionellales bacterium]|jgi:crotonobetainyl-CoA:carnitine CoA-transferase CaiB-like acyl-CoA transferase